MLYSPHIARLTLPACAARRPHIPSFAARRRRLRASAQPPGAGEEEADPWRAAAVRPVSADDSAGPAYRAAAGLAAAGALESAYLTAAKLGGEAPALCSAAGAACASVLSSPYAQLGGLPLSALGAGAYAATAAVALAGAAAREAGAAEEENGWRLPLLACATALASVSAYLLATLAGPLAGAACPYCLLSAGLSAGTLAASARGLGLRRAARLAPALAAVAAAAALAVALPQSRAAAGAAVELPFAEPALRRESSPATRALAGHLAARGFRVLGAFWCSHCEAQRELFGRGAALPYTECFPDGYRTGVAMAPACAAAGLQGFPTWLLPDGSKLEGDQTLQKLAELSGFEGALE